MFPPSLHKNIRELDKQITLLESECENMESEERKRGINAKIYFSRTKEPANHFKKGIFKEHDERPFVTGPRIPEIRKSKPLTAEKMCRKGSAISARKSATNRETPTTTSDEVKCNKKYTRNCPICGSIRERSGQGNKDKKIQGISKCVCGKELLNENNQDLDMYDADDKVIESDNEKQVLHKGILHANPGGTIEVTVTQKSNKTPGSQCKNKSVTCSVRSIEKNKSDPCITRENPQGKLKRSPRGQKWSEILCQENISHCGKKVKSNKLKNIIKSNYCLNSKFDDKLEGYKNQASVGDTQLSNPSLISEKEIASEEWNDENECPDTVVSSLLKNSSCKSPLKRKNLENVIDASPRTVNSFEEKNVQCGSGEPEKSQEVLDPLGTLFTLINTVKGKFSEEETKKILNGLEVSLEKLNEDKMSSEYEFSSQDNNYVRKLQKHFLSTKKLCEKLMDEKNKLTEDLAVKDQLLSNLNSKEKEYLSVITNLKVNLEKTKSQAEDNIEILKELNATKNKLLNETRVADALRKSHAKMQEQIQKCMLENDKLKTEIRLNKLESQKFCVLLAGKDAEIKRYKDEVESFQRQIADQLAALRTNNAAKEVQKAMEAIIQQSQVFSVTDLDSAFSDGLTDEKVGISKSKQRDKVVHSSPTSTKSSLSNCSWNHISSIHDEGSRLGLDETLNEVLIGDLGNKEQCVEEKMPSFASCKSADDTFAQHESFANGECEKLGLTKQNLRRNIKELFQDIKQKCSKKILSIPSESDILDDLFNGSETSNLSEVSSSFYGAHGKS